MKPHKPPNLTKKLEWTPTPRFLKLFNTDNFFKIFFHVLQGLCVLRVQRVLPVLHVLCVLRVLNVKRVLPVLHVLPALCV
jgi:hypothetical protein